MASTYLSRTNQSSISNNKIFTMSTWLKRSGLGFNQDIFHAQVDASNLTQIGFGSTGEHFIIYNLDAGVSNLYLKTTAKYRDANAWYHLMVVVDTTQATSTDRAKLYVNGELITALDQNTYPAQNAVMKLNLASTNQYVGTYGATSNYFDGQMAHFHFIDGTAYSPSDFGETDATTGIWKPKTAPSVTYGTNGFFLKFENSGSMGTDSSGNANNFTVNGTLTQTVDTPSNVFATLNPLTTWTGGGNYTLSNGNNTISIGGITEKRAALGTLGFTKGKYYWEVKYISKTGDNYATIGITDANTDELNGYGEYDYAYRGETAYKVNNGTFTAWGNTWTTGDIISVAVDCDNNYIYFGKNGTWQEGGDPTSGSSGTGAAFNITDASNTDGGQYLPCIGKQDANTPVFSFNFGNGYFGTVKVTSANSDTAGIGEFEYTVPTGYYALCTKNINEQEYS